MIVARACEALNFGDITTLSDLFHEPATWHTLGLHPGKQLDVLCCVVFDPESGRIIIGRDHFNDLYAWDGFWSQRSAR